MQRPESQCNANQRPESPCDESRRDENERDECANDAGDARERDEDHAADNGHDESIEDAAATLAPSAIRPRTISRAPLHVVGIAVTALIGVVIAMEARVELPNDADANTRERAVVASQPHEPLPAPEAIEADGENVPVRSALDVGDLEGQSEQVTAGRSSRAFCAVALGAGSRGRPGGPPALASVSGQRAVMPGTSSYSEFDENEYVSAAADSVSTFAIDVDTASYSNVRQILENGARVPRSIVRIEELVNYFSYSYPEPEGDQPFSTTATVASCPWAPTHQLVRVGLRARSFAASTRPAANLVFLIDVSGSMNDPSKLPLLVRSLHLLVDVLDARDRIAIVVYAGASGLVLPSTTCEYKNVLTRALDSLASGGSTNGGAGIELAYKTAVENFLPQGQNRVVLCTDGDFNVGATSHDALVELIEAKRRTGVFLSVLGFGRGAHSDATMELLADKGNGNYAHVDTLNEARKVLVTEMGGTLFTVAKDVKIQVDFNPARVQAWRLIGYENRKLAARDFDDDAKDAGEIGAGHTVTALYEVVPVGVAFTAQNSGSRPYAPAQLDAPARRGDELMTLKLRYKLPDEETSRAITDVVPASDRSWAETDGDFRFAAAVASFGMLLRKSRYAGSFRFENVLYLATPAIGADSQGTRAGFANLVRLARDSAER